MMIFGRLITEKEQEQRRLACRRYAKTEKGKVSQRRWYSSIEGKTAGLNRVQRWKLRQIKNDLCHGHGYLNDGLPTPDSRIQ